MVERIRRDVGAISERARGKPFGWVWKIHSPEPEEDQFTEDEASAVLVRLAEAHGVDTRVLGNQPAPRAVLDLVAEKLGVETVRGWITQLRARMAES